MKILHVIYCLLLLNLLVINTSCKTTKKTTASVSTNKTAKKGELTEQEQIQFAFYFVDGLKERMKGNIETAENLFKQCLKIDPNSAPTKYELGNIYRYGGLYDNALKYSKECVAADSKNEFYQLLYIDCLHNKRQYAQAAEAYSKLTKNYPYRSDFYENLAAEYMYDGNFEKSYKTYDELEKKFGENEIVTLNKIKLLRQLQKNTEAELELKKLIKLKPTEARSYIYLAEFYIDNNQIDKAMATYNDALKVEPNNAMVHLALADYYKSINDKDNFFLEIKLALENPDFDVDTKYKVLVSFYELSEENSSYQNQANQLLAITLNLHPNNADLHSLNGDFLYRDKLIKAACEEYAIATKLDKNKFAPWNQLMYLQAELQNYKGLDSSSSEAMELFPNQPFPYYFNGIANIQFKKYNQASQVLNEGVEFVVNNNPLLIQFYINLGEAHNYLKNFEKSDKAYENALKVDPDNTLVLNNYAYYLSLRKTTLEKAEKFSKRCNELAPNNRNYIDTYGWILYQQGKYKDAEVWLARALKMGAKSGIIIEHYADILFKLDRIDEALQLWKEAKKIGGGTDLLDKKINDKKINE